jgi:hypothetical protein
MIRYRIILERRIMSNANPVDPDLLKAALETRIFAAYIAGRAAKELEAALSGNAFGLTTSAIPLLHALRPGEKTMAEISRQIPVAPRPSFPSWMPSNAKASYNAAAIRATGGEHH